METVLGQLVELYKTTGKYKRREAHWADRFFYYVLKACAFASIALLLAVVYMLWKSSSHAWSEFGLGYLTHSEWNPVTGGLPGGSGRNSLRAAVLTWAVMPGCEKTS